MVIHDPRLIQPRSGEKKVMSDTYVERSQGYVRTLGRRHEPTAIAHMLKISPGTFQNLWRGRLKSIPVDLYMRLCDAVAADLRREIGHLEHELSSIASGVGHASDGEMAKMATQIEALKRTLEARK